jgi:uncharacterized membrane protein YvbJ
MSYCPKCGAKVREEMAFCPSCGAPLKFEQPPAEVKPAPAPSREEKAEKGEKREKREKTEKYEKREVAFIGPLIGGLILVVLGLMLYLQVVGLLLRQIAWALFLIIIGIVIIVGALIALRRHPKT